MSLSEINACNANIKAAHLPRVAVLVGATAGIGRATLEALVSQKFPMRLYVVGRSGEKHKAWLDQLRQTNTQAEIVWLEGQATLLVDTRRWCDEIARRETFIDLLFLCAGFLPMQGRHETSEGVETCSALAYYTRILFITQLLPLLRRSDHAPRVISVLSAGWESPSIPLDDLDLSATPSAFSMMAILRTNSTCTTLTMTRLATEKENAKVVFIHHHPGAVKTDIVRSSLGGRWYAGLAAGISTVASMLAGGFTAEQSGRRCLYLVTSARFGGKGVPVVAGPEEGTTLEGKTSGGLFCVSDKVKCLRLENVMAELRRKKAGEIVWEHTMEVLKPYI